MLSLDERRRRSATWGTIHPQFIALVGLAAHHHPMMDGFSTITRAVTTLGLSAAASDKERSLPIEKVLEEEFAQLHPGVTIATHAHTSHYVPGDVECPSDFAVVLMNAVRTAQDSGWTRQPPAPRGTARQALAQFFIEGDRALEDGLRSHEAGDLTDDELRVLLANRLNVLVKGDLDAVPCFGPIAEGLTAGNDDGEDVAGVRDGELDDPRAVRAKRLLDAAFEPYLATTRDKRLEAVMANMRRSNHFALCLSGGGIRSASFALGVLQGLGRYELLQRFHYLSTVSGGGFAGGWLSAWMSRSGVRSVWQHLKGAPTAKLDDEPPAVRHIRTFSRYLNPQLGLMSADTWTLIASGIRNILLMWLVLIPLIAAALMLPRLFVSMPMTTLYEWARIGVDPGLLAIGMFSGATLLIFAALVHVHRYIRQSEGATYERSGAGSSLGAFHLRCLIPFLVGVALLSEVWDLLWTMAMTTTTQGKLITHYAWARQLVDSTPDGLPERAVGAWLLGLYGVGLALTSWIVGARKWWKHPIEGLGCALAGGMAGALAAVADDALFGIRKVKHGPEFYATLAVPTFLALSVVGTQIFVGLISRKMLDSEREGAARLNAWLMILLVAWASAFGLGLYGPMLADALFHVPSEAALTVLGVATIGLFAAHLGASSDERAPGAKSLLARLFTLVSAPAFAASIIVLISALNIRVLALGCRLTTWCPVDVPNARYEEFKNVGSAASAADFAEPQMIVLAALVLLVVGLVLSWLIDTNRFSLHAIYSVRIVRTFIGASKAPSDRAPDPFTGFDATDDVPMSDIWPAKLETAPPRPSAENVAHPPLHVINMALNVVSSERLATQERKAESFTVTALHAGSKNVGYRRTSRPPGLPDAKLFGGKGGITLGTAVATSGAAASPNAGFHSSPVLTFLMALFNLRLGRWMGNPGQSGDGSFDRAEPQLGFLPILNEMFGRTTDRSKYVYLSDGSHFENLGLYEMVFRRCRFIVVSDAGCDPTASFDDLGGAIRKIRIDFGIPIEFDEEMSIYPRSLPDKADKGVYWAVGRIRYSAVDRDAPLSPDRASSEEDGIILYLKPAFYGREPRDIYNYARKIQAFPHESTGNQFYGEEQFESYRALGVHVIEELCAKEFGVRNGEPVSTERLMEWMAAHLRRPIRGERIVMSWDKQLTPAPGSVIPSELPA